MPTLDTSHNHSSRRTLKAAPNTQIVQGHQKKQVLNKINYRLKLNRLFFSIFLLTIGNTVIAQQNIGFIETNKVLNSLSEYRIIEQTIELESKIIDDSIKTLSKRYWDYLEFEVPHHFTDSFKIDSVNQIIENMRREISDYQIGAQSDLEIQIDSMTSHIFIKLQVALEEFCRNRNIDFLFEIDDMLLYQTEDNYTEELITFLQEKN